MKEKNLMDMSRKELVQIFHECGGEPLALLLLFLHETHLSLEIAFSLTWNNFKYDVRSLDLGIDNVRNTDSITLSEALTCYLYIESVKQRRGKSIDGSFLKRHIFEKNEILKTAIKIE